MIDTGELDQRITILRHGAATFDGLQTVPGSLTPVATVWARRRDISDGERLRGNIASNLTVARFVIRWTPGMRHSDAIEHRGLQFQITGLKELGRSEWIEITASAESE